VLFQARPLGQINAAIQDVLASRVPARLVVLPDDGPNRAFRP
jgi:hypothetical protein